MLRMTRGLKILALAALCGAHVPAEADAATATLRRGLTDATFYPSGYNGAADNTIFYFKSDDPGNVTYPEMWMRASSGSYETIRGSNRSSNIRGRCCVSTSAP